MSMLSEKEQARVEKNLAKELPDEREMKKGGRNVVYHLVHFIMRVLYRIEVVNPENLPAEGPVMLCANHVHYFDIPLIHLQLQRWVYWIARESLFRFRFTSRFMPWWGAIPLDVNNPEARSIKMIMTYLKKGRVLGIFPQGTRCRKPEKLRTVPPKAGAINFAIRHKAWILPCAVDGEFKLFRKTRLIVGRPYKIDLPPKTRLSEEEMMTLAITLMDNIFALMGKEYPLENKEELTGGAIKNPGKKPEI